MREWLRDIVGRQVEYLDQVTDEELELFEDEFFDDPLARPCTPETFRYSVRGFPRCAWNQGASYVFVSIIESKHLVVFNNEYQRKVVREQFLVRLTSIHKTWINRESGKPAELEAKKQRRAGRKRTVCSLFMSSV